MKQKLLSFKVLVSLLTLIGVSANAYSESTAVTYKQTSKTAISLTAGTAPENAVATFSTTYTNNNYNQLTANNSMTYTFTGFDGCTVTGITLSMRSNSSTGAGSLVAKIWEKTIASIEDSKFSTANWHGAWSTSYVDIQPNVTPTGVGKGENLVITIAATTNSLYCQSVTLEYEMPESYVEAPTLPETTNFAGTMTVEIKNNAQESTIYYTTNGDTPTKNSTVYSEPFSISETTTVKAIAVKGDYCSDIVSTVYTKVEEEALVDVSFSINGNVSTKTILKGGELLETSLPEVILPEGINLKGWSKNKNSTDVETFPITNITDDITLYAVFARPAPFQLVTDVKELTAGDKVIIASTDYNVAISTTTMGDYAYKTEVDIKEDILIPTAETRVFTLGKNEDIFTFEDDGKYLAYPDLDNSDKNYLTMQDADGSLDSWTITITEGVAVINNKKYTDRKIKYNSSYSRFSTYTDRSAQKPISIYKEATSEVLSTTYTPVTISSIGYATMYLADAVAMSASVEAYIATGVNGNYLQMEQVMGTLPAETGVILKAAEGEYAFIHSTEKAADLSRNLLKGTLTNEYIDGAGYVLSAPEGVVGLYAAKLTGGKFLNNANKAYLPASAVASNAPMFSFSRGGDEEDTTGIEYSSPLNSMPSTAIYDLTGRRVEKMEKGIYIVNGKKVIR